MEQLNKLRDEIDKIDKELTILFEKRMNKVLEICEIKEKNNYPILDKSRENKLLSKNISYLINKEYTTEIKDFFRCIFDISKRIQAKRR